MDDESLTTTEKDDNDVLGATTAGGEASRSGNSGTAAAADDGTSDASADTAIAGAPSATSGTATGTAGTPARWSSGVHPRLVAFFACGEPAQRNLNGVLQLGILTFALWIVSLYFRWDDMTGALVDDPVNLWFNCIPLAGLAVFLHCIRRCKVSGAVGFVGLTAGLLYILIENAFGMFTYNPATPGPGFWIGLASTVTLILAAVFAGLYAKAAGECGGGCRPDGRPRSPWLVLGLAVLSIGFIVARFLPDYLIAVQRTPLDGVGNPTGEPLGTELLERGMVARLDGAEFIPELVGWVIFVLGAPLAAWMLRRQLAASFIGGFLVFPISDLAAALAVNYSLDYTRDTEGGLQLSVDYGFGTGSLALLATVVLFILVVAAIALTGTEHPDPDPDSSPAPESDSASAEETSAAV